MRHPDTASLTSFPASRFPHENGLPSTLNRRRRRGRDLTLSGRPRTTAGTTEI